MNRHHSGAGALERVPAPTARSLLPTALLLAAVPVVLWASTHPGGAALLAALGAAVGIASRRR